jgi:CHRD domain
MLTKYFTQQKIYPLVVLCIVTALLLAACGGSTSAPPSSSTPSPPPPASTPTTAPTIPSISTTITLKHVPNGTADLSWDPGTHALTVKISLVGLAPSSMHPAHIHTGSCANQGNVIHPLTTLVADAHGVASATTVVNGVTNGIPATGWYVNVHNGPGLSTNDQFLPIVCADVANSNTSTSAAQSVHLILQSAPPASAGETVNGTAQLTLSGNQLTVKLTLSGLEPNSMHAAHIHSGSCQSQGPVVYPLTTVTADASGNASMTTTITITGLPSIPTTGWYVNVHHSTALSTQTGFDPIACGNVTIGS